jgi:hypothetical protein
MPNCTEQMGTSKIEFGRLGRRVIEGRFDGGSMTGDGGVMLLGATDRKLGLLQAAASCIADPRSQLLITHSVADMLRQRVYSLALGWEDLNDHGALRCDVAMQTAVGVDREVASAPHAVPAGEMGRSIDRLAPARGAGRPIHRQLQDRPG